MFPTREEIGALVRMQRMGLLEDQWPEIEDIEEALTDPTLRDSIAQVLFSGHNVLVDEPIDCSLDDEEELPF